MAEKPITERDLHALKNILVTRPPRGGMLMDMETYIAFLREGGLPEEEVGRRVFVLITGIDQ